MNEQWSPDEVATVIHARKILKAKGLPKDADVKTICAAAGISRKSGYQWAGKLERIPHEQEGKLREGFACLEAEYEELNRRYDEVRFENEGRKLAWKIHGVDELLANKKNTTKPWKRPKR